MLKRGTTSVGHDTKPSSANKTPSDVVHECDARTLVTAPLGREPGLPQVKSVLVEELEDVCAAAGPPATSDCSHVSKTSDVSGVKS